MNSYPNNIGQWEERDGIRIEAFHDGSWIAYTTTGPFRSVSSADGQRAKNITEAVAVARVTAETLKP